MYQLCVLILLALTSCNSPNANPEADVIHIEKPVDPESIVLLDSLTENRYGYIKDFENYREETLVKVDFVDYLTGQEALDAEWRDKAYFVDGDDTITNITDGYYISNVNPVLRTFEVKKNISVLHIIDDEGPKPMLAPKPVNLKLLESYIQHETLLFLYIKQGIIYRIDEQFVP